MKEIDKVAWIHIHDRRMLFLRSKGKEAFYFPGGKREGNESDAEVLARELKEELGIEFKLASARRLGQFTAPADGAPDVTLKCACYFGEFEGTMRPLSEIAEIGWFTSKAAHTLTPMGKIVLTHLRDLKLID